ncbi:MAG: SpoIID/LytB domain-containing protein, partial [Proteobacteria bacterium]|nr:SpoIID/LytB domain-containing protein [Pseudomonadota bacterium]
AYYHANSGGHTEDAKNVWGIDVPYLKGAPDSYSENIPGSAWQYFLSYDDLKEHLNRWGAEIGSIGALEIEDSSPSGRILQVKVFSDKGTHVFKGNNFRINVGGTRLKSTLFRVFPKQRGVLVTGNGYGHGVGMSQWGAHRMAQAGYTYQDILDYYYRDISIMTFSPDIS